MPKKGNLLWTLFVLCSVVDSFPFIVELLASEAGVVVVVDVLEFRRRGVSHKLMCPVGVSSVSAGHTSPGFSYHTLSLSDTTSAGDDRMSCSCNTVTA